MQNSAIPQKAKKVSYDATLGVSILLVLFFLIAIIRRNAPDGMEFVWAYQSVLDTSIISNDAAYKDVGFFQRYWPLIGYQFLHGGTFHLIMNASFLFLIGPIAEIGFINGANLINYNAIKSDKSKRWQIYFAAFLLIVYFLSCGVASAYGYHLFNLNRDATLIGASGAISGVFSGYLLSAIFMIKNRRRLYVHIFISASVFILINVFGAYLARQADLIPIAWEAHLSGLVSGLILYPIFRKLSQIIVPKQI